MAGHWHGKQYLDAHWQDHHWVQRVVIAPPESDQIAAGGVQVGRQKITGHASLIAQPARLTAKGLVRITGRCRVVAPAAVLHASGVVRLRGSAALASSSAWLEVAGVVANTGWVVVADENDLVIITGGRP